jgi:cysteine desulfurase / selenocysteine lyase
MNNDIRNQFPILGQLIHNKPLIYFDNAATTQKPMAVLNAIQQYYTHDNANIHRGVHTLAERATLAYETAREKVRAFINAKHAEEIIFVRGTTEAINLVAQSYGRKNFQPQDEIIVSAMEHHSNLVPWQLIAEEVNAKIKVINISPEGLLDLDHFASLINAHTKIIAITHVSNTLGTINPIKQITSLAHRHNIPVVVDGAQAVAHLQVDVQDLDCDFYAFSGHKLYAPTGIGVLYGKKALLDAMPPYQGGGQMINKVTYEKTEYADLPRKFEAGTPNIEGTIALGAAIDFLNSIGMQEITKHDQQLLQYANSQLPKIKGLKIFGTAPKKIGVISLVFPNIHPHDIATILDNEGIAVRAGHHCNMPLMDRFGLTGTTRVSFGVYNQEQEIDSLILALHKVKKVFAG